MLNVCGDMRINGNVKRCFKDYIKSAKNLNWGMESGHIYKFQQKLQSEVTVNSSLHIKISCYFESKTCWSPPPSIHSSGENQGNHLSSDCDPSYQVFLNIAKQVYTLTQLDRKELGLRRLLQLTMLLAKLNFVLAVLSTNW